MPANSAQTKRTKAASRALGPRVAVIGLGYVGLPLALLAETRGYDVAGFDIDARKIRALRRKTADYISPEEALQLAASSLESDSSEAVLDGADIFVVCVPTPVFGNRLPDLRPLRGACAAVGRHLKRGALVIIESTVSPGVCEGVALLEIEAASGMKGGKDFDFAHCPERVNPGDAKWNVRTIPRVIGGIDSRSLSRAKRFYEAVTDAPVRAMESIREAEAVKMVENAFRDVNIAFVNELAMSFSRAGIDITNVLDGASTKPFGFTAFSPGCGVGGHCIPVDPYYLIRYGRENGFEHRFLVNARRINSGMPAYTVRLLENLLNKRGERLRGSPVALLGLSYKRDIPDLRESPAEAIQRALTRAGARVRAYDPHVRTKESAPSLHAALEGAKAAIIATDHTAFTELPPETFLAHGVEVVVDGRNCLPKAAYRAAGIAYAGIGR